MTASTKEAVITRALDAPPDRVWRCLAEPEHFAAWFGTPPMTTDLSTVVLDLRPGGEFRATMVHETDGTEQPFVGHYVEVDPGERIVLRLEDPDDASNQDVETLTLSVRDLGEGRAELTYRQTGHLPDEQYPLIEQGVNGFFDRLEEHLAQEW